MEERRAVSSRLARGPSVGILITGSLAAVVGRSTEQTEVAFIGSIVLAIGRSAYWLLWFELYGCLNPIKMMLAFCGSTILSTLLWPFLKEASASAVALAVVLLPSLSLAMYVGSWRRIPKSHVPSQIDFPILRIWKLMAWCATYSFAYGVCTSIAIPASYDIAYFARIIL